MPHVSPSQIHTWRKCRRKWAYSRVRPRSSNKYAAFGSKVHEYREHWLRDCVPPDANTPEGRCAIAGLELLPMPGTVGVEVGIRFTFEDVVYVGYADVLQWAPVHVHDHKSCGSFDYALTEQDLLTDPQRIIYSFWAAWVLAAPQVGATWHYLQRKPPRAKPVSIVEDSTTIAARFVDLHRRDGLPIIQSQADGIDPENYPRSLDHCSAYGGCPFAEECLRGVSPIARAAAALRRAA